MHPQTVVNGPFYYMFGPGLALLYVLGMAYVHGSPVPRLHGQGKCGRVAPATTLNLLFYGYHVWKRIGIW